MKNIPVISINAKTKTGGNLRKFLSSERICFLQYISMDSASFPHKSAGAATEPVPYAAAVTALIGTGHNSPDQCCSWKLVFNLVYSNEKSVNSIPVSYTTEPNNSQKANLLHPAILSIISIMPQSSTTQQSDQRRRQSKTNHFPIIKNGFSFYLREGL